MKMTSAYANKMLRTLNDEKEYWLNRERESFMYTAAVGEEPVIPEYDYEQVSQEIAKIDEKIIILKHAINESNVTARIPVGDQVLSVDTILVKMTLMNRRKDMLDTMRKQLPKARTMTHSYTAKTVAPEYRYINYDLDTIRRDFEQISHEILEMQVALDRYNQTEEFEVAL